MREARLCQGCGSEYEAWGSFEGGDPGACSSCQDKLGNLKKWKDLEQAALRWMYETAKSEGPESVAATILVMLRERANEEVELATRIASLEEERKKLRAFAAELFAEWPEECGIDGFDLQDLAVKHGLLVGERVYEPCQAEGCFCEEMHGRNDIKVGGITCYRKTPLLTGEKP